MSDLGLEFSEAREPTAERKTPLGQWLTDLRLSRNLANQTVSAALRVNQARVCEWETGERIPEPLDLRRLLEYYGAI